MAAPHESTVAAWYHRYFGLSRGKWFLICFTALASLLALTLIVIEHPILDQDSARYIDGSLEHLTGWKFGLVPWHGTVLPLFVNYWPARLFRYEGVVIFNSLVVVYGLSHLFAVLNDVLRIKAHGLFLVLYLTTIAVMSFTPLICMMIESEPITLGIFALTLSITIARKCCLLDLAILALFSAYHTSNIIVLGVFLSALLVWSLARERGFAVLISMMLLCLLTSHAIDRSLIRSYGEGRTRLEASFVGSIILNYYPFVLQRLCEEHTDLRICRPQTRAFIEQKRTPEIYQPGRFLWASDKLYILPSHDPKAPEMHDVQRDWPVISISEFEQSSRLLAFTAIRLIPGHLGDYLSISLRRIRALFWQNQLVNYNYIRNRNLDLSHGPLHFIFDEKGPLDSFSTTLKLVYLTLIPLFSVVALLLPDPRRTRPIVLRICALGLSLYLTNLLVMGTLGTAVSRYHYRAFFILSVLLLCIVWHVVGAFTSRNSDTKGYINSR